MLEPLPALLSCVRRLAMLAPADGGGGSRVGDGSDDTLMLSASQLVRAEDGCESSQELQVRAWHTQRPPVRDKLQPCV